MDRHHYLLLLGTDTDDESWLRRARERLLGHGQLRRMSDVLHAPSVVSGDDHHYANQALIIAAVPPRAEFAAALKQIERELGRPDDSQDCLIDIDLAGECDEQDRLLWTNPAKLAHPLFRELVARVLPAGALL